MLHSAQTSSGALQLRRLRGAVETAVQDVVHGRRQHDMQVKFWFSFQSVKLITTLQKISVN